jgi:hypothetical protein
MVFLSTQPRQWGSASPTVQIKTSSTRITTSGKCLAPKAEALTQEKESYQGKIALIKIASICKKPIIVILMWEKYQIICLINQQFKG